MTKKLSQFQIIMKNGTVSESYRISESLFATIRETLAPYRSNNIPSKPIKCIETGIIFKNANHAKKWLFKNNLTTSITADATIKSACKGQRPLAYGYHWEFIE